MGFDDVRAQGTAIQTLRKAVRSGRVASTYLFEGPTGVGKLRTAIALGQALICAQRPGEGCGKCEICRRIVELKHPDVRVFAPRDEGHRNIQVEFLRAEILPVTQFAPFEAKSAVLIFPDADVSFPGEIHPEASNAILKTIEEPRANVHFVLTASQPQRLLPTIRSRCQPLRFGRLPEHTLRTILEEASIPEARIDAAIALADGRADRALAMAQEGAADALLDRALRVDAAVEAGKPGTLVDVADDLAKSEDLALSLETLATFYRDVAVAALGQPDERLAFRAHAGKIRERARTLDAGRAAARTALLRETMENLELNANPGVAMDALLFDLKHLA